MPADDPTTVVRVTTTYLIVRHGETDENVQRIIQGQLDTQLNDHGRAQARAVGEALRGMPIDEAWTSDLRRARDTAEAIMAHHPGAHLHVEPRLRERRMGSLEGKTFSPRRDDVKGIESMKELVRRLQDFYDTVSRHHLSSSTPLKDRTFLFVSHGATIKTFVLFVLANHPSFTPRGGMKLAPGSGLDDGRELALTNAGITEVRVVEDVPVPSRDGDDADGPRPRGGGTDGGKQGIAPSREPKSKVVEATLVRWSDHRHTRLDPRSIDNVDEKVSNSATI